MSSGGTYSHSKKAPITILFIHFHFTNCFSVLTLALETLWQAPHRWPSYRIFTCRRGVPSAHFNWRIHTSSITTPMSRSTLLMAALGHISHNNVKEDVFVKKFWSRFSLQLKRKGMKFKSWKMQRSLTNFVTFYARKSVWWF